MSYVNVFLGKVLTFVHGGPWLDKARYMCMTWVEQGYIAVYNSIQTVTGPEKFPEQ